MRHLLLLLSINVLACNPKTDIIKQNDGSYSYTKECHTQVGEWKREAEIAKEKEDLYRKRIKLKDLTIADYERQSSRWMELSFRSQERLEKIERMQSANSWLMFGVGVGTTVLAIWASSKLRYDR